MLNFRHVRHLSLFLAVAEELHFGRAAQRLGMSQPPLSEQIRILEQAIGGPLFDRDRRGVRLTPLGSAILPAVRKFSEQLGRLELAVREAAAGQTGTLTIGSITSAMLDQLPSLIGRLRAEHPRLTISVREIDSVEALPALHSGDIDLAFARLEGELSPPLQALPMARERLAVALPRDHAIAKQPRVRLSSLARENFVMFSRSVSPIYFDTIAAACLAHGFSPRVMHEVRSVASQVAFVGCGQGIALVPTSLRKLAPATVVLRPLKEQVEVVTAAMAWNADRPNAFVATAVALSGGDD